jgi:cellulose synthase/poly-beta-1,6-N-acetylglucosamine synthase-like glycosyltransferase
VRLLPWLVLAAFFRPLIEAYVLVFGHWWVRARFRRDRSRFRRLVVQITTVGTEEERVNEIIAEIRSYPLSMPHEIWVVNEPGHDDDYPLADRVITTPGDFAARSRYKARALEYSRHVRRSLGYNGPETKIVFLDDDTSPTREYLETAFEADYDICQGTTAPRIRYGAWPLSHFLLSHIDDLRFHNCMTYCSATQGLLNAPLFVHGEGLTVTGRAEEITTWNYPVFASEDLTFGCNAAARGLRWGYFHEYIELTSPWTWGAYFKQRRRWMWGNIHAIFHRDVLPLGAGIRVGIRYLLSLYTFVASAVAVGLILSGAIRLEAWWYTLFWCSLVIWVANYAIGGWVNAGRREAGQTTLGFWTNRVWQTAAAVLLAPVTATWTMVALVSTIYMGNPRSFEVIAKTARTARAQAEPEGEAV